MASLVLDNTEAARHCNSKNCWQTEYGNVTSEIMSEQCSLIKAKPLISVNRNLLIDKLTSFGVNGVEGAWFKSYLSSRTQHVSINGVMSNRNTIKSGVPQGSILGPLVFLLFINDMPRNVVHFTGLICILMVLWCMSSHNNINTIEECVNEDLDSLCKWLDVNPMKVTCKQNQGKNCMFYVFACIFIYYSLI